MQIPERYRLPIVTLVALILVVAVGGAIVLVGHVASNPSASPSTPTAAETDPGATPESAVRAFFGAIGAARKTDDPTLIRPLVTSDQSSAYQSVAAFLLGQKDVKRASVLTVQRLENISVQTNGTSSTVRLLYTEGGYDISLDTGKPVETPNVLAPRNVTMTLRAIEGRWLVDSYEAQAQ